VRSALLLAALAESASCFGSDPTPRTGDKPDVVLIVVDTLRADMVVDPHSRAATPHIDRLAADGVLFSQAFSHAPMTLPAHTALFSSRAPFETGVLNNWQDVRSDLPLLAEWLHDRGYGTRAVVSLGTLNPRNEYALDRGFDDYDVDYWHMDRASNVMERLRSSLDAMEPDKPLFLFAHFSDPHTPYNAHGSGSQTATLLLDGHELDTLSTSDMTLWEREIELEEGEHVVEIRADEEFKLHAFQCSPSDQEDVKRLRVTWEEGELRKRVKDVRASMTVKHGGLHLLRLWVSEVLNRKLVQERYALEVAYVDRYVGELLDELRARGLYDDSLILFTSDHGEALGERNFVGHVQNLHDEMLHVPLVVKLPRGDRRARLLEARRDSLVPQVDIAPTILDVIGLEPMRDQRGRSMIDEGSGYLVAETHRPESKHGYVCLRDERFKMIYEPETDHYEMYDLAADPGETRDVFESRRAEREEWVEQLATIARLAGGDGEPGVEADPEVVENLKALGYF